MYRVQKAGFSTLENREKKYLSKFSQNRKSVPKIRSYVQKSMPADSAPDPKHVVNVENSQRVRRVFLGKDWTSARGAAVKDQIRRTSEHHGEGGRDGSFIEGPTALIVRGVESSLTIPRPTVQPNPWDSRGSWICSKSRFTQISRSTFTFPNERSQPPRPLQPEVPPP